MSTPYISVQMLNDAPTGIAWNQIPELDASESAQAAEQLNLIWRATSMVDTWCNQVLRAMVANEELSGPGTPRVGWVPDTGVTRIKTAYWPVIDVLAVQTSAMRSFPRVWSTVPADQCEVEVPILSAYTDTASATTPDGGSTILLAPGNIHRRRGRNGYRLLVSYTNGWPHTSLTQPADAEATTLYVDDVTGWAGASGFAYDGAATEQVSVTAVSADSPLQLPNGVGTAQSGPGTVTLSSGLGFSHAAGTIVSALPANVIQATILACVVQALESGIDAITAETLPGAQTTSGHSTGSLEAEWRSMLAPYRRIV